MKNFYWLIYLFTIISLSQTKPFSPLKVNDVVISCTNNPLGNGCLKVIPEFTDVRKTNLYSVNQLSYPSNPNFNRGNEVIMLEDHFSDAIPIGFKFDFYGQTYENIVVSENGVLSFNIINANQLSFPRIGGSISNPSVVHQSIFGAYQDLKLDALGKILYSIEGNYPFRRLIITFNNMLQNGCNSRSTTQIILHETFNEIDILIDSKPIPCNGSIEKDALIGIKNNDTQNNVAPLRDVSQWQATKEAWNFKPNGLQSSVRFEWIKNGQTTPESTVKEPTLCPGENTTYTVKTYYTNEDGTENSFTGTQTTFKFQFDPSLPRVSELNHQICDIGDDKIETVNLYDQTETKVLDGQIGFTYTIHNTLADAKAGINAISRNAQITFNNFTTDRIFYYRLENTLQQNCFATQTLKIRLAPGPTNRLTSVVKVCHPNGNPSFLISDLHTFLDSSVLGNQVDIQVTYHKTRIDAENYNPQTNDNKINTFTVTPTETQIFIRLTRNGQCVLIDTANFQLDSQPALRPIIVPIICDNLNDNSEFYNLHQHENSMDGNEFQYFLDSNLTQQINPLTHVLNLTTMPIIIYVKAINNNGCFVTNTITIQRKINGVMAKDFINTPKCDVERDGEIFNLKRLAENNMLLNPNDVSLYNIEYFKDITLTQQITDPTEIQNYKVLNPREDIYIRFTLISTGCNYVRKLLLQVLPPPIVWQDPDVVFCRADSTSSVSITETELSVYNPRIIGFDVPFFIEWYKDSNLTQRITNANPLVINTNTNVWIKMIRPQEQGGCFSKAQILIHLSISYELDIIKEKDYLYCDNLNNNVEYIDHIELNKLKLEITKNNPNYKTESYYIWIDGRKIDFDSGTNIWVLNANNINQFYIDVFEINKPCGKSTAKINLKKYNGATVKELKTKLCIDDFTTHKENLTSYNSNMNISSTSIVTYYLHPIWAANGGEMGRITNPTSYTLTEGINNIYVRETNTNGCYDYKLLEITTYKKPIIIPNTLIFCDDLDDVQENNYILSNFNNQIIANQANVSVSYHNTEAEALDLTNVGITTANINSTTRLWIRLANTLLNTCNDIKQMNFIPESYPVPNPVVTIEICDNNNDQTELFDLNNDELKKQIIANPQNYDFEFYNTQGVLITESQIITPQNTKFIVRVYTKNSIAKCFKTSDLTVKFYPGINAKDYEAKFCDEDLNNQIIVADLTAYKKFMLEDYCSNSTNINNCLNGITDEYYRNYNPITNQLSNRITNLTNYVVFASTLPIYVKFSNQLGCFTIKTLTISQQQLNLRPNQEYKICDNDLNGNYDLNLNELNPIILPNGADYTFTYYRNQDDYLANNPIQNTNKFEINPNQMPYTIWIKADNGVCSSVETIRLITNVVTTIIKTSHDFNTECDDDFDGRLPWNLTSFKPEFTQSQTAEVSYFTSLEDANLNQNKILNPLNYSVQTGTSIYLRITEQNQCPVIAEVKITLKTLPVIPLEPEFKFCQNESITISGEIIGSNIPEENYVWRKGNQNGEIIHNGSKITINIPGDYTLSVLNLNGCSTFKTTKVKETKAPEISQLIATQNSIRIIVEPNDSPAPYIYYMLVGDTWKEQDSNIFTELSEGIHTFKVKSKITGCESKIKRTKIFNIRDFISPNGDGQNDKWIMNDLDVFDGQIASLKIFDRYGTLIHKQESNSELNWDGTYLHQSVPYTTYWYEINLPDGRIFTGHIVVKGN